MRKSLISLVIILSILLAGCAASAQVLSPTPTPKATWTMHPHGVLKACIYYGGEIVNIGYLKFFNDKGVIDYLDWVELKDGCKDVILSPGNYEISASYFQLECADAGSGCKLDQNLVIEISDGDVIKVDFEVYLPE